MGGVKRLLNVKLSISLHYTIVEVNLLADKYFVSNDRLGLFVLKKKLCLVIEEMENNKIIRLIKKSEQILIVLHR